MRYRKIIPTEERKQFRTAEEEGMFKELWQACAGPLVTVPGVGHHVFYFPQGHIEQVEASTGREVDQDMPTYGLPSKILCRVMSVHLKAEPDTDEVFAQVVLLPLSKIESLAMKERPPSLPPQPRVYSFSKTLTASDTSPHGGFSILKRHADECLPRLDLSKHPAHQDLVAKDLHGNEWRFRHVFRGHPKRHLLQTGWNHFVSSKKLVAGDTFVFLRGESGQLCVGVRRAMRQSSNVQSSVISSHNMHIGVLATAWLAVSTGREFTVHYKPRTSPAEFLVPCVKYIESVKNKYPVGMRFNMMFEGEELTGQRFTCTVIEIEDADRKRFPGSKWRCLKVCWDKYSPVHCPERVSPWQLEPASVHAQDTLPICPIKRPWLSILSSSASLHATEGSGSLKVNVETSMQNKFGRAFQGQNNLSYIAAFARSCKSDTRNVPLRTPPTTKDQTDVLFGKRPFPPGASVPQTRLRSQCASESYVAGWPFVDGMQGPEVKQWSENYLPPLLRPLPVGISNNAMAQNFDQDLTANESRKFKLFGVSLIGNPTPQMNADITSEHIQKMGSEEVLQPVKISTFSEAASEGDKQAKGFQVLKKTSEGSQVKLQGGSTRSCIKVKKQGTALGRSIDLSKFNGYDQLLAELDQIFEFNGELIGPKKKWIAVFTDTEGDMMLVGDDPWEEFCHHARKITIYTEDELKKMA